MVRPFVLVCILGVLGLGAGAPAAWAAEKDAHGDPLPAGALARLGTVRLRHEGAIVFASFLPGDQKVMSLSEDGVLCVWELPSGRPLHRTESMTPEGVLLTGATLSPDGKYLTVSSADDQLRVWDWASKKQVGQLTQAARSRAGTPAFRSRALAQIQNRSAFGEGMAVYSQDSRTLLLYGGARALQLIDLPGGKEIGPSSGHREALVTICFTPDGSRILTADAASARIWDAATGKEQGPFLVRTPGAEQSPRIVSGNGGVGLLLPPPTIDPDTEEATAAQPVLFDPTSGAELGKLELEGTLTSLSRVGLLFSPSSRMLALHRENQPQVGLYDIPGGKLLHTLEVPPEAAEAPRRAPFAGRGGRGFPRSVQAEMLFSPNGRLLAFQANPEGPVVVFDTRTGKTAATLAVPSSIYLMQGAFSPSGRCLALRGTEGTVTLYELAVGQPRRTYGGVQDPRAQDRSLRMTEAFGPRLRSQVLSGPRGSFAFSPDGQLLALPDTAGAIALLDVATGEELAVLRGHTGPVHAVAFAPDGKKLASASHDTTALVWDVSRVTRPAGPEQEAALTELEAWWQALAEEDATAAGTAMSQLVRVPRTAVGWIRERVKPAPRLDAQQIARLIRQLDDDEFEERERAERELFAVGEGLLPVLEKALADRPSPEAQRRLEQLRGQLTFTRLEGDRLRVLRAVEVLELIGTLDSREVLRTLAAGAPGTLVTVAAREALMR